MNPNPRLLRRPLAIPTNLHRFPPPPRPAISLLLALGSLMYEVTCSITMLRKATFPACLREAVPRPFRISTADGSSTIEPVLTKAAKGKKHYGRTSSQAHAQVSQGCPPYLDFSAPPWLFALASPLLFLLGPCVCNSGIFLFLAFVVVLVE